MKVIWVCVVLIIMLIECLSASGKSAIGKVTATAPCRDPRKWPFLSTSIWNTPIGSGAVFHDPNVFRASFPLPDYFFSDDDYFIVTSSTDPPTEWFNQGWWGDPDEHHCNIVGNFIRNISFPYNFTVRGFDNNNAAAILLPDNHSIINTQPLYRCYPSAPMFGILFDDQVGKDDIVFSNGTYGAHGGTGLSSIGGTIRLGELLPDAPPIQHALKLQLNAHTYYYNQRPGYVWPALFCDSDAFNPNSSGCYGGNDSYVSPGALLAIPSNMTVTLTTVPAKKILFALQNYGGYLVDDTFANRGTLNTEHGVTDEFQVAYGYSFDSRPGSAGDAWYKDMVTLFQSLRVVINNGNTTIGGGGTPLQPPAPPLCPI